MHDAPNPEILLQHRAFMVAIARDLLGDADRAEDMAQEGLLVALRTPPRGPNIRGWLGAVVRKLALMSRRDEGRRARREQRAARRERLPSTDEAVGLLEVQRRVVDEVLQLAEPYRTTVIQRFFYGLSVREIAKQLDVPKETVKTRLNRALRTLRARLDAAHGGHRRAWCSALIPSAFATRGRAATASGAIAMNTNAKLFVAAVALLITLLLGWRLLDRDDPATARASAARETATEQTERKVAEEPAAVLTPTDFAGVDRDRDLHGIVVDQAGRPVAGARLQVIAYPWKRVNALYLGWEAEEGPRTVSRDDGKFALRLARGALVELRVSRDGFAPLELAMLQAGERVRVVLSSGVGLAVLVRVEGVPAHGARVAVTRARHWGRLTVRRTGETDARGRVLFDDLPAGATVGVYLWDPRFANVRNQIVRLPDTGILRHELDLPRGRMLNGRVLDFETGKPIAGAEVGISWALRLKTTTDADGRFEINGGSEQDSVEELYASAEGYGLSRVKVGEATQYQLRLVKGFTVTGRLLDLAGRPVAGARVSAVGTQGYSVSKGQAASEADGRFAIRGLGGGMLHTLILLAPGFARTVFDFEPEDGDLDLGNITLGPGHGIEGRILTADGNPSPRTQITLRGANRDRDRLLGRPLRNAPPYGTGESRFSDDLGRFRFVDLPSGDYTLKVERRGATDVERSARIDKTDVTGIEVRLPPGRRFTVIVTDVLGNPVPRVMIGVRHEGGGANSITGADGVAVYFVKGKVRHVGEPHPLPTGVPRPNYLRAQPIDDLPKDATEARFRLEIGDDIEGEVVDEWGKRMAEVIIRVQSDGKEIAIASSDSEGRFRATVPTHGTVDLIVTGQRKKVKRRGRTIHITDPSVSGELRGVAAGTRDLRLVARRPSRVLEVRVEAPDGSPLAGVRVKAGRNKATTDRDGTARLEGLPARAITLVVQPRENDRFLAPKPVKMTPNGQKLVLRGETGIAVSGIALREDGSAAAGASIIAQDGEYIMHRARADAQGRFTLFLPKRGAPVVWATDGKNTALVQDVSPDRALRIILKRRR